MPHPVTLTPLAHFPLVEPGDSLARLIIASLAENNLSLAAGDVLVIAQKVISKSENRYCYLNEVTPSARAQQLAIEADKDPRVMECILQESTEVMRVRKGAIIVRHRNGYVHANAGIDRSNISSDEDNPRVLLLPENPDASARAIVDALQRQYDIEVNVVISDSAGRPWRNGITGFALGTAGFEALEDHVGAADLFGNRLQITQIGIADELAAAASLLMGQGDAGVPVVLIRGMALRPSTEGSAPLIRDPQQDLFR